MSRKLVIIDGNSYVYRSFYAIRGLKTSTGIPTNAVYGFVSMLIKLLNGENPDYMAIAFDMPEPTFRHEIYSDYKANRPSMPEELRVQFPLVKEIISAFKIGSFECRGYEADDIIATLAWRFKDALPVFVMSQDKDCLQLARGEVNIIRENNSLKVCDEESVRQIYGIPPRLFPDVMALCGDASDNIAGVHGIGWKTAVKLVKRFGSLEEVISSAGIIENKILSENLLASREKLLLNKKLVSLDMNVPLEVELESLKVSRGRSEALREIFTRLEFKKLLDKI